MIHIRIGKCGALLTLPLLIFLSNCGQDSQDKVSFNQHIRPILSDRCWACHGPDANSREAELRLDTEEGVATVIESEFYHRITSSDPDEQMPPPESELSLSDEEIALLKQWIDEGAEWQPHWAFIPPEKADPPRMETSDWAQSPIDNFVLAKMEENGFSPSEPADKATLLRRISLDLTGLPPTPEDLDTFLADESADAYENAIDRLLASPHYGEQMAVDWMDVARYADTHGYQADAYRPHWPWRDWVIEAFNENMPFDQFVRWQLAGDLMPDASKEQILATGFNRNHAQNGEGGIVQEEYRVEYVADRASTFSTAFLGMTMQCARCHDHKYDPLSQKEFYSLFSFFNQVPEAGQITWNFDDMPGPTLLLSKPEEDKKVEEIKTKIGQLEQDIEHYEAEQVAEIDTWLAKQTAKRNSPPGLIAHYPLDQASNKKLRNPVNPSLSGKIIDPVSNRVPENTPQAIEGIYKQALALTGDDALTFPKVGRFSRADAFSVGMWAWIPNELEKGVIFHSNKGSAIYTFKGYQVSVEDSVFDLRIAHDFPASSIHKLSKKTVPRDRWTHLMLTYDGSSQAKGATLYVDGEAWDMNTMQDDLHKDIIFHPKEEGGKYIETMLKVGARWRGKGLTGGKVDDILVFDRQLQPAEVAGIAAKQDWSTWMASQADKKDYLPALLHSHDKTYQNLWDSLHHWRMKEVLLTESFPELMVMADQDIERPTYVLNRGVYDSPTERVYPTTPARILPFPEDLPPNRLGLAQWLFLPENPLPARVIVNRYWAHYFGRGLVKTVEDFGSQGELPSHPELLDWLAVTFVESGYDIKALQKRILMTATYQQSSEVSPILLAEDPENVWLTRGPKSRLSAEMLRDQVLAASGLLVPKIGGPPVKPYQPEGLWAVNRMSGDYDQGKGDDLYRRSLYTFWKRTNPPPSMNTFDAPNRSYCVVQRQKTSTPLQALVLMNDPQFLEAARLLAERVIREGGESQIDKLRHAYLLLTAGAPSEDALSLFSQQLDQARAQYEANPDQANGLLTTGEYPMDADLDPTEIAAFTVVATTMINLDATMTKR